MMGDINCLNGSVDIHLIQCPTQSNYTCLWGGLNIPPPTGSSLNLGDVHLRKINPNKIKPTPPSPYYVLSRALCKVLEEGIILKQ